MDAKCVIFAFCVIFFSLTDAHHHMTKNFKDIIKKCVESTGVDESVVSKFFVDKDATTDDPKVKCYFKCIMEEIEWLDKDGNVVEGTDMGLPEEKVKLARECISSATGDDACEKSYNFQKCYIAKKHEAGLLPPTKKE